MSRTFEIHKADDYKPGAWRVAWRDNGRLAGAKLFNAEDPERDARAFMAAQK